MHKPQELQEQVKMLASIAIAHNGTASNNKIAKRVGDSRVMYRYVRYLFDFQCTAINLYDKVNPEHLYYVTADMHLKIDDNLLAIVVKGIGGYKKVITQMNATTITIVDDVLTLASPTCMMELR